MKAEIKLSIQPCFPHTTCLMVIIRIQLMISLSECSVDGKSQYLGQKPPERHLVRTESRNIEPEKDPLLPTLTKVGQGQIVSKHGQIGYG